MGKKIAPAEVGGEIAVINEDLLKDKVYTIRGVKVMLDADLAEIYGYSTKDFNRQVKNNQERFAEDFRFQLTKDEIALLSRCKIFTLKKSNENGRGSNIKYNPYAFTEQGIYMLMTVLKGDLAIRQSMALIRLFKDMKDYIIAENQQLIGNDGLAMLGAQTSQNTRDIARLTDEVQDHSLKLQQVMDYFVDPSTFRHFLFVDGQKFEADIAYTQIYNMAQRIIFIVDDFVGIKTLDLLRGIAPNMKITIFSDQKGGREITEHMLEDFRIARPDLEISVQPNGGIFHDRYIFIDYGLATEKFYHCGTSSKDAGSKVTTVMQIFDKDGYYPLIGRVLNLT